MITIFTGRAGTGKTLHAYSLLISKHQKGRETFTNIRDTSNDVFSFVPGESSPEANSLPNLSEFYRHIKPGSFVVIDEFDHLVSEIDRDAFFDIWFHQHLFSGTELILIGQSQTRIASFFHHSAVDSAIHKSVNPIFLFRFSLFSFPFIGKVYRIRKYAVDTVYLEFGLESQSRNFRLDSLDVSIYSIYRTIKQISSFLQNKS
ncbi:zonular occludens toxin domain-containing protein [Candidatus Electronema sp. JM]|uniref:zonular occludens toxin domain-containing protein n=1 Tax=Candidatus Electronema sp. JM TaxID=3401571 RepID=UPI003AA991A0